MNPRVYLSSPGRASNVQPPFAEALHLNAPLAWVSDPVNSVVTPYVMSPGLMAAIEAIQVDAPAIECMPPLLISHLRDGGLLLDEQDNNAARP